MVTLNYKLRIFYASLISVYTLFTACNTPAASHNSKHYSEETLQEFKKVADQYKSRDTSIYLIDSLYKTFPYISAVDKYRYYDFMSELVEFTRYDNRSYDTVIAYVDSSISVIEDNRLEKEMSNEYVKAFTNRGDYYTRIQRYNYAIKDITRSKQLNREAGDSCLMAENTKTLSLIAHRQSEYSLAISLNKEATLLAATCKKDPQQFRRMQGFLNDLGYFYEGAQKYDSALLYYLAAEKYVLENKSLMEKDTLFPYEALENIYGNIGNIYYVQKNYAASEFYTTKAILIDQDILHDSMKVAMTQYILATTYFSNSRISEADALVEKILPLANKFPMGTRAAVWGLMANIAREKKNYKEEAEYLEKWRLTKDTVYNRRIELLKKNPFTEYEQLDKKYQVDLLEKDNRNQQNKTKAAIVIGVLVTLLALISLFLLRRLRIVMKKRAVVFNKLAASEKELKETMVQKEAAEKQLLDNELFAQEMRLQIEFNEAIIQQRSQISDDIHDELSSSLAALNFYVEDIMQKSVGTEAEQSFYDIKAEVSTIYESARRYMHNLKKGIGETRFSIIEFVNEIQQKFSAKGLMNVKLNIDQENIQSKLNTHQHDQLYHIIKESIANTIKHARATQLLITVRFFNNECIFSITDNGIGIRNENVVYGIGTQSMRSRIEELKGTIAFKSIPEEGYEVSGSFPVQNA